MDSFGVPKKINRYVLKAILYYRGAKRNLKFMEIYQFVRMCNRNLCPVPNMCNVVRESLDNLCRSGIILKDRTNKYRMIPMMGASDSGLQIPDKNCCSGDVSQNNKNLDNPVESDNQHIVTTTSHTEIEQASTQNKIVRENKVNGEAMNSQPPEDINEHNTENKQPETIEPEVASTSSMAQQQYPSQKRYWCYLN